MDRSTNYVVVGAFVLLVLGMALSFVYWYTDQRDKRTYVRYEIYYDGSVSGLTAGSPVRASASPSCAGVSMSPNAAHGTPTRPNRTPGC